MRVPQEAFDRVQANAIIRDRLIEDAVGRERERCAKQIEEYAAELENSTLYHPEITLRVLADEIRKGK